MIQVTLGTYSVLACVYVMEYNVDSSFPILTVLLSRKCLNLRCIPHKRWGSFFFRPRIEVDRPVVYVLQSHTEEAQEGV